MWWVDEARGYPEPSLPQAACGPQRRGGARAPRGASVSKEATTPEDAAELGLTVLGKTTHALTVPIGLDAAFDVLKSRILIHVDRAPGMRNCIVELSTEPIGLGTWNRLPGFGAVKTLTGYAPGTYWVRAASARAKDESDFIGPVSVIVK